MTQVRGSGFTIGGLVRRALLGLLSAAAMSTPAGAQTREAVRYTDLGALFTRGLESTEELDYGPALDWFGLQFSRPHPAPPDPPGWLGAKTKIDDGRLIVENVPRGTPAYAGGVNPGDEILAIDDFRVRHASLDARLAAYRPGRTVTLLVSRRDELKRLAVTLGEVPPDRWTLQVRPDATPQQRDHLASWLK